MKYFHGDEIIQIVREYVTETRYKQAIMINGEWGSGKTHFVEKDLIPKLKELTDEKGSSRKVLYISLYGIENTKDIINELLMGTLENFFDEKFKSGSGKYVKQTINITSKLMTAGLQYFNIPKDVMPSLEDFNKLQNSIIIVDDLERCSIELNTLMGFLNNLVEHNSIKMIIVANETEIANLKSSTALLDKYSVVLNPHLKIKENKTDNPDIFDFNELHNLTNELFSTDFNYEKIKEKLIGFTINYRPHLKTIYSTLLTGYIIDENVKQQLEDHQSIVITTMAKYKHQNIRTLVFAFIALENIFKAINQSEIEKSKYLDDHYEKILQYTLEVSIRIKTAQKLLDWSNTSSVISTVRWENKPDDYFIAYKFADDYLTTWVFDPEIMIKSIKENIDEEIQIELEHEATNSLKINQLRNWILLEDEEIESLYQELEKELEECKYPPRYFKDILILLIQLKNAKFIWFNFNEAQKKFIDLMRTRVVVNQEDVEMRIFDIVTTDPNFQEEFRSIIEPLIQVINNSEPVQVKDLKRYFGSTIANEIDFENLCYKYEEFFLDKKRFFSYIPTDDFIEKIKSVTLKDMYSIRLGIRKVYAFSNLNDFYKNDIVNLEIIIDQLREYKEELEGRNVTRTMNVTMLIQLLEESLTLIRQ